MIHTTPRAPQNCLHRQTNQPNRVVATPNPIRMLRKTLPSLALAIGVATLLQGCNKQDQSGATQPGTKRLHLAFVANSPGEYWSVVNLGCSIAAQQLGDVDVDFRYPTATTIEAQQQIVTNLLAAGVDGIAISPIDAERQTDFLNYLASQTLLICADSDAAQSKRVKYIGTDNVAAGKQVAALIQDALPAGGKIAVFVGYAQAQNTKDRLQGIRSGLDAARIKIVEILEDGQQSSGTRDNVMAALAKHPDLAGVVGISGYHGPELLTALRAAGKTGSVKIVCFDDNSDTLAGIVAGDIHGTIAQKPFHIGKQTIVHLHHQLRHPEPGAAKTNTFIESRVLTRTNVEHHMAQQRNISVYLKDKSP